MDYSSITDQALEKIIRIIEAVDVLGLYKSSAQLFEVSSESFNRVKDYGFFNDFVAVSKMVSIFVTIFSFLGIIYLIKKRGEVIKTEEGVAREPVHIPEPASGGMVTGKWREIMNHIESGNEHQWKLAVIEADKLIDDLLKKAGFPGDTMGERLTNTHHDQLRTLHYLWQAHRLRNRIVHEPDFQPSYKDIHEALSYFKATLEELGVI